MDKLIITAVLILSACAARQTKCLGDYNYVIKDGYAVEYLGECKNEKQR